MSKVTIFLHRRKASERKEELEVKETMVRESEEGSGMRNPEHQRVIYKKGRRESLRLQDTNKTKEVRRERKL